MTTGYSFDKLAQGFPIGPAMEPAARAFYDALQNNDKQPGLSAEDVASYNKQQVYSGVATEHYDNGAIVSHPLGICEGSESACRAQLAKAMPTPKATSTIDLQVRSLTLSPPNNAPAAAAKWAEQAVFRANCESSVSDAINQLVENPALIATIEPEHRKKLYARLESAAPKALAGSMVAYLTQLSTERPTAKRAQALTVATGALLRATPADVVRVLQDSPSLLRKLPLHCAQNVVDHISWTVPADGRGNVKDIQDLRQLGDKIDLNQLPPSVASTLRRTLSRVVP